MVTTPTDNCQDCAGEQISTGRCQADVQSRYRHQVARAASGVTIPLIIGDQVSRTDHECGESCGVITLELERRDAPDETLPQLIDAPWHAGLEKMVATPVDHIAHRTDVLASQPGFEIENTCVARAARSAQA